MFAFTFHTSFIKQNLIRLAKRDIDKANKDSKNFNFPMNFGVDLFFRTQEDIEEEKEELRKELDDLPAILDKVCHRCTKIISKSDFSLSTNRYSYHWNCLICDRCAKPFAEMKEFSGSRCVVSEDQIFCENCNLFDFFPKCKRCSEIIGDNLSGKTDDMCWHSECFTCECCMTHLNMEDFDVLDEMAYCVECLAKPEIQQRGKRDTLNPTVARKKFLLYLLKGDIERRAKKGDLNQQEITWLIDWASNDDREPVNHAAVKALASAAYPTEIKPGLRQEMMSQGLLDYLLHYSSQGSFAIHQEILWDELQIIGKVGSGASGSVYKANYKGKQVAVKEFNQEHISFMWEDFRREMAIACLLGHENIVHCLGGCIAPPKLFLVSEFMTHGSLRDMIEKQREELHVPDPKLVIKRCLDIAKGLVRNFRIWR